MTTSLRGFEQQVSTLPHCRHLRLVHADAHAVTRDARLCDLEQSLAYPVAIANARLLVREPVDREILPELPAGEVISTELAFPVMIGVDLIDEYGPMFAAMSDQVALPVAIDIEPPNHPGPADCVFPHGGVDGPALPGHILRHADIHR
jgi:hypothetical protein